MSALMYDNSIARLDRAQQQLHDYVSEVGRFLETDPYAALIIRSKLTGECHLRVASRNEVPKKISILFGELLYSLRISLDYLIHDTYKQFNIKHKNAKFSFSVDKISLKNQIIDKIKNSPSALINLIEEIARLYGYENLCDSFRRPNRCLTLRYKHLLLYMKVMVPL